MMDNNDAIFLLEYLKENYAMDRGLMRQAIDIAIEAMKPKTVRTNGDRIRGMTDEELAEFLDGQSGCRLCDGYKRGICNGECIEGHLAWLQKEVDEDA